MTTPGTTRATMANGEAAAALGIPVSAVSSRRHYLREAGALPAGPTRRKPYVSRRDGRTLAERWAHVDWSISNADVAARHGLSVKDVGIVRQGMRRIGVEVGAARPAHPWTAEEDAMLGTMSDPAIARRLGIPWSHVRQRRYKLGVASVTDQQKRQGEGPAVGRADVAERRRWRTSPRPAGR